MTSLLSPRSSPPEPGLLEAALGGDDTAFRHLVEPHRQALHVHCYRMLGSVQDAEDALQDALLRAWRALPRFDGGRPLRPWLYKVATNVCLDALARQPKRVLPSDLAVPPNPHEHDTGDPVEASVWMEPYPDEWLGLEAGYEAPEAHVERREAVELAFIAALQHLQPKQRAVLILREVLGFSAREVSVVLETTVASVNSALQRARTTVDERLPGRTQQVTLRTLGDERIRRLARQYVEAWESADVDRIVAMLAEDVTMEMPPYPYWWRGRDELMAAVTLPQSLFHQRWRYLPTRANGQLAFGGYVWDPDERHFVATAIEVLTLEDALVRQITQFAMPRLFERFGLPETLPSE